MSRSIYQGPWRVDLTIRDDVRAPISGVSLARAIVLAAQAAQAPSPASIGLVLSDDVELAELNATHLGEPGPTDVLSVPLLPVNAFTRHPGQDPTLRQVRSTDRFILPPGRRRHLGDIVISVERAAAQAPGSLEVELRQLVVHGVLHICGWDHAAPAERDAMRALESKVLAS